MPGDIYDGLHSPLETIAAQVQQQRISSWLAFSAYSPNNLRFLPQPIPKDLHTPLNTRYTFHDAFEDLLLVWSGHSLRDIVEQATADERRHQALWDTYFPYQQARLDARSILEQASKSDGCEYHRRHHDSAPGALVQSLVKQVSMCEEETTLARILGQLTLPGPADLFHLGGGSRWAALQELDELHDPWLRRVRDADAHNDDGDRLGDANTEDELYQALSPRLSRSWPGVALPWERTMEQRLRYGTGEPSEGEPSNSTVTETVVSLGGSRVVTRTTLRLHGGITERSVATERRDTQGLATERTTHVTRVPSDCSGPSLKSQEIVAEGRRPAGTTGWFWARSS